MWQFIAKTLITALVVVAVAEIGKRSTFWAAVIASLPLISILAFIWLYIDTGNTQRIAELSHSVFWLVLPSLTLFLVLPALLRSGVSFWLSLVLACGATAAAYSIVIWGLGWFGIRA